MNASRRKITLALAVPYAVLGFALVLGLYLVHADRKQNDRLVCETIAEDRAVLKALVESLPNDPLPPGASADLAAYVAARAENFAEWSAYAEETLRLPPRCVGRTGATEPVPPPNLRGDPQ